MKKIVALVLSLVMVLGLATTAFAATTTVYGDKDVSLTTPAGVEATKMEGQTVTKYEQATSTTTVDGKTVTTITPAYFTCNLSASKLVIVDKSLAEYILKIEDVGTFYVALMGAVPTVDAADVATEYTAPLLPACGVVGSGLDTYYVLNGKYYAADKSGAATALVNGNYVRMSDTATLPTAHDWNNVTVKAYNAKTSVPTQVECPECDALVDVYAVPGTFDGKTYVAINTIQNASATAEALKVNAMYFVAGAAANTVDAPAADAADKVESAQTFDAGIAMYVGMSVMAAAGSAVVLKKKD